MIRASTILAVAIFLFAFLAYSPTSVAQVNGVSGGTFVFLSSANSCPGSGTSCYLDNGTLASSVVSQLRGAGGDFFLLPSASPTQMNTMATAINAQGGHFLTFEEWEWKGAFVNGQFDCDTYTSNRIIPVLLPLKAAFPSAFYGFQFMDEPIESDHQSLGELKACLMRQTAFAGMKVFLNLPPLDAAETALTSPDPSLHTFRAPADYGVDCTTNTVVDRSLAASMVDQYTTYVLSALDQIQPDVLAFDQYPFTPKFDQCSAARDLVMSENMSIISSQSLRRGVTPVAYLQNVMASPLAAPSIDSFEYANFHKLRWYSSWFFVFGGQGLANFVSHDEDDGGAKYGMLTADNQPRNLLGDQQSNYGMTGQVQRALAYYPFRQFVAPFLGVSTGSIVGWMPSTDLLAGEYGDTTASQVMLYVARRPQSSTVTTTLGLNQWWVKIEKLNFDTGLWETVGQSTNAIDVNLDSFPGALYRLSSSP